jgi:response regulator RpfG family c-di-GMP phosphodiesterase
MNADYRNIKILVIDDEPKLLELLYTILKRHEFDVYTATDGEEGIELFKKENPSIILTDIHMPVLTGIEILKIIKKISPISQVIVFSGVGTTTDVIEALRLGASDYLVKPFNMDLLIHTVSRCVERYELIMERIERKDNLEREVRERTAALTNTFYETIKALGLLTEKRDPYTAGHQQRVALLGMGIGRKLGLTQKEIEIINVAGLLHDIGKVAVPTELLVKPSKLRPPEIQLMKLHPEIGYDIIKDIPFVESLGKDVSTIVLQHHERLDGTGYPKGLTDDELELESKILSVSDVVEAMSSHRPYRATFDMATTKSELIDKRGISYCTECVDACLQLIEENNNDAQRLFGSLSLNNRQIISYRK